MSSLDRSHAPTPGPDSAFRFPEFRHCRLESGLELYLLEQRRTPLVSIRLLMPWGGADDPASLPGLAAMTAALLEDGTTTRSSRQIADEVESLGGSLWSGAGWSSCAVSTGVLARDLEHGLELLSDVATHPVFPATEVERERRERLADWLRRRDQPSALAEEAFAEAVYGGSPYGHPLQGDRTSLEAIERDDVVRFWSERRSARGATLLVVGDVDGERVLATAGERLADLGEATTPATPPIEPPAPRRRLIVVDRPGAAQTELRIGHPGPPRRHPDATALLLLNNILGGKFTSRVNLNLRERHGFTYGASTAFVARRGPGPFLASTAVANAVAARAAEEILSELARIREQAVPAGELALGIRYLRGVFPYGLQSHGGLLSRLEELATFELPDDHYQRHFEQLAAVDADRLLEVARAHLHPDAATVIAVGPAAELEPLFSRLGPVEVRARPAVAA